MSLYLLQTLTDGTEHYRVRDSFEGQDWLIDYDYNVRRGMWTFSVQSLEGVQALAGQAIVCGIQLLARAVNGPPGKIFAIPEDGNLDAPGLLELGARVKLYYEDSGGIDA